MTTDRWYWQIWLVSALAVAGAIVSSGNCAWAQQSNIVPDGTLGAEGSQVTPDFNGLPIEVIDGGAQRGANLFHSFQEFNVSEGRGAYFFSPSADILNILARVTGSNRSEILGTLGTFGDSNPNLFLMNPNGIIFGANASLDVGGSFAATTANALQFGNQGSFSAAAPDLPPLLTVNPSALLFNQIATGSIENNSIAPAGLDPAGFNSFGLRVPEGQSLLLVGGDVSMNSGQLNAFGGRVEVGGLAGAGIVGLDVDNNNLQLSFPDTVVRGDILLTNGGGVDVTAGDGGSIAIEARNLEILEGSFLFAGLGQDLGAEGSQAGDITLNATEAITVAESNIFNLLRSGAVGNGGNIHINAGSLSIINGATLAASTLGQGDAGSVRIDARETVSFDGSFAFSTVEEEAKGQGGNVAISAGSLSVINGAQLITATRNQGYAGNVTVNVRETVSLNGVGSNGLPSGAFSTVQREAVGRGGNINITTGLLSVTEGAQLQTATRNQGDAGNVMIHAREAVSFDGEGIVRGEVVASGAYSTVEEVAVGKGGDITITTGLLSLTNGAELQASTFGQGDAGNVTINTRDTVFFDGETSDGFSSGAFSLVQDTGVGQGGDVTITTGTLSVTNGAQLVVSTFGQGNAGNVTIDARDTIFFDGVGSNGFSSAAASTVEEEAEGQGGNVTVATGSLSVANGAGLLASTSGQGDAGNITIDARDTVSFSGVGSNGFSSGLFTATEQGATGQGGDVTVTSSTFRVADGAVVNAQTLNSSNGGDVTINANTFEATNGGQVLTTTRSSGRAGNITLNVADSVTLSGSDPTYAERLAQLGENIVTNAGPTSGLFANTAEESTGQGGDLKIATGQLTVEDGAQVSAATSGSGQGGTVSVAASETVTLSRRGRLSAQSTADGNAGSLTISTRALTVEDGAETTVSSPIGQAGDLTIMSNSVLLDRGNLTAVTGKGQGEGGANINLQVGDLLLMSNESQVTADALGTANGGNINIDTDFLIALPPQGANGSDIRANAFQGNGGRLNISAQGILGIDFRPSETSLNDITASSEFGTAGVVTLNTPDVDLQNSLTQLAANFVSSDQVVAGSCLARRNVERGSFTVTGTGGLPSSPYEAMSGRYTATGVQPIQGSHTVSSRAAVVATAPWKRGEPIQEAQGMVVTADGRTIVGTNPQLVALAKAQDLVCP